MGIFFINGGRKVRSRASLYYCNSVCGDEGRPSLGSNGFQKNGFNTTINPYGRGIASKVATYVALQNNGLGGRPTWSFKIPGKKFGLANPPSSIYNPENEINQYGRLKGTSGRPLRNF